MFQIQRRLIKMDEIFRKLLGKSVKIHLRRDERSSKYVPEFIIGILKFIDQRTGVMILQSGSKRYIFPNRSVVSFVEVEYGR